MRSRIFIVLLISAAHTFSYGQEWTEPQQVSAFFLDFARNGELISGVLRERTDDFFSFYEGEPVFEYMDAGNTANSLFSGSVQIMQHPRSFRSLQYLLPQAHFTALIDLSVQQRINPGLLLPLVTAPEQSSSVQVQSLVWHEGYTGASIVLQIHARYGRPGAIRNRPPAKISLFLPEEEIELFTIDFSSGRFAQSDDLRFQRAVSGYRFEYPGFYPGQLLRVTVHSPEGRKQEHSVYLPDLESE